MVLRKLYADQEATVRTRHGKTDLFKLEKQHIKAVYCLPAYLTSMQSTSYKMQGWMKNKLESRFLGEISTSDMQMTTLMAESKEELKSLLMRMKEESEKDDLKRSTQNNKIMASRLITSWQINGEKWKQ